MSARLLLTINAVIAILFGLGFVFIPNTIGALYGVPPEAHATLSDQFFGSALLPIGVVNWLAKDLRDWQGVRAVLIANAVGSVFGGGVNLLGTFSGLLNGMAWTSTLIYALLLIGAVYCLATGPQVSAAAARPA
jgi:hypothetical protein